MRTVTIVKTSISQTSVIRFWALSLLATSLVFCYAFLLVSATAASASVKEANNEISKIKTEIADLEVEYFKQVSEISADDIALLEMREPSDSELSYIDLTKENDQIVLR